MTTPSAPEDTCDPTDDSPLPYAPLDVQVRDAAGGEYNGEVVAADLVLVTAADLRAPAVVIAPDGSQVTAVKVVGPERHHEGIFLWALELPSGTVPVRTRRHLRRPLWCAIFGSRLAACR